MPWVIIQYDSGGLEAKELKMMSTIFAGVGVEL
jgi:hypothetical protein